LTDGQGDPTLPLVRRIVLFVALGYVVLAFVTRAQEAAGLRTCTCHPDCWCQRPGLSLFRWVFPRFHHEMSLEAS
jgi:hypothetical protein